MNITKYVQEVNNMRLVTVHLPAEYLSDLDELVRQQRYPNRSETIRVAIRDLLREELWRSKSASTTVVQHSS